MSRTKLRLEAHPSGGARAGVSVRGLLPTERLQVAAALFWALLTGRFRLDIPHATVSVRGNLLANDPDA